MLAELEADGKLHLSLVYRGTKENAGKFIDAQDELLAELYAPEEEDTENEEENAAEANAEDAESVQEDTESTEKETEKAGDTENTEGDGETLAGEDGKE